MKYIYNQEEDVNFTMMYSADPLFTKSECERIKKIGDLLQIQQAKTFGGDSSVRKGKVAWLPKSKDTSFIYDKIFSLSSKANDTNWKFDLIGLLEDCQYTTYESKEDESGDFYGCHLDIDGPAGVKRKISAVVQLSDPRDYEGGELEIYTWDKPFYASKQQGSCLLFPSFLLHKVTPVTKGKRNSLVLWVSGKPFK